jgi:phosphatidylethanolamine-binding protein (PEBP) family uncharacterized protein
VSSRSGLASGAGAALPSAAGAYLPSGAIHLTNDLGVTGWSGVHPPPGTGTHRLYLCVAALDVDVIDVPDGTSLAMFNILMIQHTLGRAVLVGTSQPPSPDPS